MLTRIKPVSVHGHVIPEPRITLRGCLLIVAWVGVPVFAIGALVDLFVQLVFGVCTGLWCLG